MRKYILLIISLLTGASQALTAEDSARIAEAFVVTNRPQQVKDVVYPMYSNIWFNLSKTNPSYGRELQYNILTNLCSFNTSDVPYWMKWGLRERRSLLYMAYDFTPTTNDMPYVNLCAEYLGQKMNPIEYELDLPNGGYSWYNDQIAYSKTLLVRNFAELVAKYEALLTMEERPSFRTNIIERARLTEEERRIIWPDAL